MWPLNLLLNEKVPGVAPRMVAYSGEARHSENAVVVVVKQSQGC